VDGGPDQAWADTALRRGEAGVTWGRQIDVDLVGRCGTDGGSTQTEGRAPASGLMPATAPEPWPAAMVSVAARVSRGRKNWMIPC
jgi:hypothetical protein